MFAMADFPIVVNSLSQRELEVLSLAYEGLSVKGIADRLFVTDRTVNFHLGNVYKKFGVRKKKDAIAEAIRQGYFE